MWTFPYWSLHQAGIQLPHHTFVCTFHSSSRYFNRIIKSIILMSSCGLEAFYYHFDFFICCYYIRQRFSFRGSRGAEAPATGHTLPNSLKCGLRSPHRNEISTYYLADFSYPSTFRCLVFSDKSFGIYFYISNRFFKHYLDFAPYFFKLFKYTGATSATQFCTFYQIQIQIT